MMDEGICPTIDPNKSSGLKRSTSSYFGGVGVGLARSLVRQKYKRKKHRRDLAEYLICDDVPFQVVEGHGFRQFVNHLKPRFPILSKTIVARDCWKLYLEEAKMLKKYLKESCGRVCLTIDTWTSVQNFNYLCVTAHFINHQWDLQKRILDICMVEKHGDDTIGRIVEKCLLDWEIDKVFSITMDGSTSNDTVLAYLKSRLKNWDGLVCGGDHLHVMCYMHVLNSIVYEGLKDLHDNISSIRNAIRYVRSSPTRLKRFKSFAKAEKLENESFPSLDVSTHWDSTYAMLETAMKFQKVFDRMKDEDEAYNAHFREDVIGPPVTHDWRNANVFLRFFKVFYDIALRFLLREVHVTSDIYFHQIAHIRVMLNENSLNPDPLVMKLSEKMQSKYDKYWGKLENLNLLLVIPVILDPRYKLAHVNHVFEDICHDLEVSMAMKQKVKDILYRLLDEYSRASNQPEDTIWGFDFVDVGRSEVPSSHNYDQINEWFASTVQKFSSYQTELDRYLSTELVEDDGSFDILSWWRENATRYEVLSLIARDVLAMPISTMTCESAFSIGGRVLDSYRSSLSPKMTKALICAQNWLVFGQSNPNSDFSSCYAQSGYFDETSNIVDSDISGVTEEKDDMNID